VYPVARYEKLVKELGATASLYVFLKIALKKIILQQINSCKGNKGHHCDRSTSKLQPIVTSNNNNNPNSTCRQDEVVVQGVEQSRQEYQQNDQELVEGLTCMLSSIMPLALM